MSQYANLLIPFVSMGMSNAIIRFGLDRGNSKKQVFTNGLLSILLGYAALILLWPVARLLPDMAQYGLLLYVYVLMSCLRTLCTQFVRSQEFNKLVAVDGILCTFATLMFYVLYLVVLGMGANGYLLAIISGDLTSVVFLTFKGRLWQYLELKTAPNTRLWKQMLRFSLPMIPAQISFWVINASDLFFVREMCGGMGGHSGEAWSGLLSTGYFLPTIVQHAGADLLRCLAAVCGDGGRGAGNVFYPDLPHLFLRDVLLRGGHPVAVPPADARDEGQLLRGLALCAVFDPGGGLLLLQPVFEQRLCGL